jgi:Transglutaminase-like superfamily
MTSLDPRPLEFKRPAERRMVGFCYHFALLHCALLRATGTPARVRCGFAGYFAAHRWIDHWAVEYWDGEGWRLTDPQVGRTDLTRDDFPNALTAWNQCRSGASTPDLYGNGELWGWDELRGSLINDVAALNKVEVAGWYWCDRIKVDPLDQPHNELDASLDILCRLAATAESVETIKECFTCTQGCSRQRTPSRDRTWQTSARRESPQHPPIRSRRQPRTAVARLVSLDDAAALRPAL